MKLVFFCSGSYVIPVVEEILKEFEIIVFTSEKEVNDPLIEFCKKNNIKYVSVSSFNSALKEEIISFGSLIALTASFGLIIPEDFINLFPEGILNIHPSLLPKYRGASPVQSAILNGDRKTGVSIIKLDEKMDHGPILWQKEEEIKDNDTGETLYLKLFTSAAAAINQVIKNYLEKKIIPQAQEESKATYVKPLTRKSGYFELANAPEKETLERMIRAYSPWPGVWTKIMINNKELRIKLLPNNLLQVEGKTPISLKDFKNGYPEAYNNIESILK